MKTFKKMMALIIAMVMVLSMGATAFATPADTTLKVEGPVEGHTYTAYQLFVGDLAEDGKTLSNVKWGSDVITTAISYTVNGEAKTVTPSVGREVPQEFLDYVATLTSNTQDTANTIGAWVAGTGTTIDSNEKTVKTGYYVVKDAYTDPSADTKTTLSTYICEVVGPTEVAPKAGTTEHKKEVLDINDTTDTALNLDNLIGVEDGWDKSADHDFGDHVPFKLTTTIGSDFAKYTSYYLAVSDTLKDGLKLDQDSIKVYVDGELATEGTADGTYKLTKAVKSFKVEFTKLNGNAKAAAGKDVVIVYTATLDGTDANIVIGNPGNWNESYAEFSNNPNGDQSGKGKTPKDTAVVFTYKTDVDKVEKDATGTKALAGAEFTLTKTLQDGSTKTIAVVKYDKDGNVTTKTADGTAQSEGDATKFEFKGLDDGTYTLTETVTPNGYNTIDPIVFVVSATHNATEGSGITELTVKDSSGADFSGDIKFKTTPATGTIETDILNQKGATLPSTGGIGTTVFYVIGAILVLGAGIVLVTRRRMSAN